MSTESGPVIKAGLHIEEIDHQNDPSLKLSNENVKKAREAVANGTDRVYRIYTDGIFDLFHVGHMNMLKQAKHALGNPANVCLVAGVCSDEITLSLKGKLVMNEETRYESLRHCKWVDEVIEAAPWVLTPDFIEQHKIDFVAHDALPYVSDGSSDVYAGVKEAGKFLATNRTTGISTTDLIVQIVKDYDVYVIRNLQRGIDKKSLNVGRTWEIRAVAHLKGQKLDENMKLVTQEKNQLISSLRSWSDAFGLTNPLCTKSGNNNNNNNMQRQQQQQQQSDTTSLSSSPSSSSEHNPNNNNNTSPSSSSSRPISTLAISDDAETSPSISTSSVNICLETRNVIQHSYLLTVALVQTSLSALSYLNVFSYIDMCRQTSKYSKKD